jgi:hypothetical protein
MRYTLLLLLAGCASEADPEPLAQVPTPDCDAIQTRHICGAFKATAGSAYGVLVSCETAPFVQTSPGVRVYREHGLDGCTDVALYEGAPVARCCP